MASGSARTRSTSDTGRRVMPEIHPETGEVVDEISRTVALRAAEAEKIGRSHRATADVIATLEDRAWRRGWIIGFATGFATSFIAGYLVWWCK